MNNIICLQEFRIKKQLNKAHRDLTDVRLLISHGEHDMVESARRIEKEILDLEVQLLQLIEEDSF